MPDSVQTFADSAVGCRLRLYPCYGEPVPSLLVEWIEWDSGFRDRGLRIGDRITAIDGTPVAVRLAELDALKLRDQMVGGWAEPQYWAGQGASEGGTVTLDVRRRAAATGWERQTVSGTLRAARAYRDANNSALLWPEGPNNYERDGFYDGWPAWYEALQKLITEALKERWRRPSYASDYELRQLLEQAPRVDLLMQKYPGPFARTVRADFDAAVAAARGATFALSEADLAYRRADEERIAEVAAAGRAAFDTLTASTTFLPAFPAPDPIHTPHDGRVGQLVLLPDIPTQQWINDGDLSFLLAGSESQGRNAVSVDAAPAQRLFGALRRYQRLVHPRLRERYTIIGRIIPEARIVVFSGQGYWCWQVEPVAGWISESLFVDVSQEEHGVSRFAGEDGAMKQETSVPPDDASPRDVLETMIAAIKFGDLAVWKALFASWQIRDMPGGYAEVRYHVWQATDSDFESSRSNFASRLYDARVCWVDDPVVLLTGQEFAGAPRIEQVDAEIEHIGRFGEEYRAFNDVTVRRVWQLQRIDGGPWRITTLQQI